MLIILLVVVSCSHNGHKPKPWTKSEKASMGLFALGEGANTWQIKELYDRQDEGFYEINPIIDNIHEKHGMTGVVIYKAISTGLIGAAAHYLTDWRDRILKTSNFIVWGVVGHDYVIGLRFRWW